MFSDIISDKFIFEEHPIYTLIKSMLEEAQYLRTFSFTRLRQDIPKCYYAVKYAITLKELLEKDSIRCESFLYAIGQALRPDQCLDSLYIIGSEDDAKKETNRLVEIVSKCPDGELYENVLEKMKFSEQILKNFNQTIADAKEDKKEIINYKLRAYIFHERTSSGCHRGFLAAYSENERISVFHVHVILSEIFVKHSHLFLILYS